MSLGPTLACASACARGQPPGLCGALSSELSRCALRGKVSAACAGPRARFASASGVHWKSSLAQRQLAAAAGRDSTRCTVKEGEERERDVMGQDAGGNGQYCTSTRTYLHARPGAAWKGNDRSFSRSFFAGSSGFGSFRLLFAFHWLGAFASPASDLVRERISTCTPQMQVCILSSLSLHKRRFLTLHTDFARFSAQTLRRQHKKLAAF